MVFDPARCSASEIPELATCYLDALLLILVLQVKSVGSEVLRLLLVAEGMGRVGVLGNWYGLINHGEDEALDAFLMGVNQGWVTL
jgi:hypothetical protein